MAQFTYTTIQQVATIAQRNAVYTDKIPSVLAHLVGLDITLMSLSWDPATKLITVVLDKAISQEQLDHLGLR
jgi:hypothetical protein